MSTRTVLVDTSAWIEFLRGTGSPACVAVRTGIGDRSLAVTDPVFMELLGGARANEHDRVLRLLNEQHYEPVAPRVDWLDAATIFRGCRSSGITVRSQTDCLIAAVAIRTGLPVMHHDRDFGHIARVTALSVAG